MIMIMMMNNKDITSINKYFKKYDASQFSYGRYEGQNILECNDIKELLRHQNCLYKKRKDYVKLRLKELGISCCREKIPRYRTFQRKFKGIKKFESHVRSLDIDELKFELSNLETIRRK